MKEHSGQDMADALLKYERDLISGVGAARWEAASALGEYAESAPEHVWPLVVRYGSSGDKDLRSAIATCILEHLLEHHFNEYFPRLRKELHRGNENLRDTFKLCWKFGKAELPENAAMWDLLLERQKGRVKPKELQGERRGSGRERKNRKTDKAGHP